jgi:hypothetical protein
MRASFPIHSVKQPTIPVVIARSQRARAKSRGPMTGSATKQSRAAELDCFATLAMTKSPLFDSLPAHKGSGTPADAYEMSAPAGAVRATERRLAPTLRCGRARLSAFHHGSRQRDFRHLWLSFRPGFLGRGRALDPVRPPQPGGGDLALLHGRYPRLPVPAQGCTSRPGHSAGRLMPEAARERS